MENYFVIKRTLVFFVLVVFTLSFPLSVQSNRFRQSFIDPLEDRIREPNFFTQLADRELHSAAVAIQGLQNWYVGTVATTDSLEMAISIDANNQPHVAYQPYNTADLNYAYYQNGNWVTQVIESAGLVGYEPSIDVDSSNNPHISYRHRTLGDLKYAYYDGVSWHIDTVDSEGSVGWYSSLKLDQHGFPHISYLDTTNLKLKYAYYDGVIWHIQTVADITQYTNTSLGLDITGNPHIAYISDGLVKYAYHDGSTWIVEILDFSALESIYVALTLDHSNRPHLAYYSLQSKLVYTYYNGYQWRKQTVGDIGFYVVGPISIDIDRLSRPHISYHFENAYSSVIQLMYAYHDGLSWHIESPVGDNISRSCMKIDAYNRAHIIYQPYPHLSYAIRLNDSSQWSRLVFASFRDMNFEVYTASGDGNNPLRLTYDAATDTTPKLNHGATKVVFVSNRDGNSEIYTMDVSGANLRRLTWNTVNDALPSWSPDQSKIAFYSNRDGNYEIYTMNSDGTQLIRLTYDAAWDGHPTWSPDGSKIAFASNRGGSYDLWIMDTNGSNLQRITTGLPGVSYPDWSPDGAHIAFNYDANADSWLDLAVINIDGTGLTTPLGYSPSLFDYLAPAWSPDGNYLAFTRVQWIQYQGNWYWVDAYIKYSVGLNSAQVYTLVDSGYDWWADWSSTDNQSPTSGMIVPSLSGTPTFTVKWWGYDNGISGIKAYDVQYRVGVDGAWVDWLINTHEMQATFTGLHEHTYFFRVRARDHAGNLEAYSQQENSTHIYRYRISGQVLGNRAQPVFGATVNTIPSSLKANEISNGNGDFNLYYDDSGMYSILVNRHGFSDSLPMHNVEIPPTQSHDIAFYLSPVDNRIINGDFEALDLSGWSISGTQNPVLTTTAYTGNGGVQLGGYISPTVVSNSSEPLVSTIEQTIVMSQSFDLPTLSLLYKIIDSQSVSNTFRITLIGESKSISVTLPLTSTGWTHAWWDLSFWEDPTLTVRMDWFQVDNQSAVGVIIDKVSLGSANTGSFGTYLPLVLRRIP